MLDDLLARLERGASSVSTPSKSDSDGARDVLERLLSRIEPREAEQVAHQPLHAQRVAADDLEERARLAPVPRPPRLSSRAST